MRSRRCRPVPAHADLYNNMGTALLADRRISSGGHVAVVVGPGLGGELAEVLRPQLGNAVFKIAWQGSRIAVGMATRWAVLSVDESARSLSGRTP